jgi:hypothetical protein
MASGTVWSRPPMPSSSGPRSDLPAADAWDGSSRAELLRPAAGRERT